MDAFRDRVAVVTGGASGIGKGLVGELARRGAKVVVVDLDGARAKEVAASVGGTSAELDVRDAKAFEAVLDAVIRDHGRLDLLFNNAGIAVGGEERDVSSDDWSRVLDVNLHGVIHGSRAAYARMLKQGGGHIVNTASVAGLVPTAGEASYAASKFGVVGLSYSLRCEGAALGVKVSVVCPGFVDTPILESPIRGPADREKLRKWVGKPLSPEACAKRVLDGVARNDDTIVVTAHAKFMWALTRISPSAALWVTTQLIGQVRKHARLAS